MPHRRFFFGDCIPTPRSHLSSPHLCGPLMTTACRAPQNPSRKTRLTPSWNYRPLFDFKKDRLSPTSVALPLFVSTQRRLSVCIIGQATKNSFPWLPCFRMKNAGIIVFKPACCSVVLNSTIAQPFRLIHLARSIPFLFSKNLIQSRWSGMLSYMKRGNPSSPTPAIGPTKNVPARRSHGT